MALRKLHLKLEEAKFGWNLFFGFNDSYHSDNKRLSFVYQDYGVGDGKTYRAGLYKIWDQAMLRNRGLDFLHLLGQADYP